ncbi:hypothetical protein YYG_01170 [Plasmodium vinckei petteri]|uniref:Merozoite surface protein 8, putative n=1 Tax=Plasmodium vinckei petteri TaxID=138298 RepID=W7AMN9_PLAVN|nr:hypothetical protein YYG_01170 [Plasmodium vinckei petteri]CAD2108063.1 merozoite surface protein 8, putative [Plasmodium vinckei petteri]
MNKSSQIIIFLLLSLFCNFSIANCGENGNKNNGNNKRLTRNEKIRKAKASGNPQDKETEILNLYDDVQELLGTERMNMLDKYYILGIDDSYGESDKNKIISEYDLKAMKSVLLYKNKISRVSLEDLYDVKTIFKRCYNKDDPELSKSYEKIEDQAAKDHTTVGEVLSNYIAAVYTKMNDEFIKNDGFKLVKYIPELEIINYAIMNGPKEMGDKIINSVNDLNKLVVSESLNSIYESVVSGLNINCKIKNDLMTILNLANGKYFKIELSGVARMVVPGQYSHEPAHMKKIQEYFIAKNRICQTEQCPLNSNCYVIDGVETCRCIPGFINYEEDGFRCEIDDFSSCDRNNGGCDENATCITLEDKIMCECNKNFNGDGIYCSNAIFYGMNTFIFFLISIVCVYIM